MSDGGEIKASEAEPIQLDGLRRYSLTDRKSKVRKDLFARPLPESPTISQFLNSLPNILAAKDFKYAASAMARARRRGKPIILGMGAHPIKVGLSPIIISMMEEGFINAIAMNGACLIHDFEIALAGHTSEDVPETLMDGSFGMAEEPAKFIARSLASSGGEKGLASVLGEAILRSDLPHKELSILAAASRLDIMATAHVAIGTDTVHMHPEIDGALLGRATLVDFRKLAKAISMLEGGVYINLGSAVILPEVFLKALALVRNLGHRVYRFTTINMDFIRHYRPEQNVVKRPTVSGGKGISLVGHHEIMFPLLSAAAKEAFRSL